MDQRQNRTDLYLEELFEFFVAKHIGTMRQRFSYYLNARKNTDLHWFVLEYIDMVQSNIVHILLAQDEQFIPKLEKLMQL